MSEIKVCILGVGFVGLTLAISLCDADIEVLAWEKNKETSENLASGITEINEPFLAEKLAHYSSNKQFRTISDSESALDANVFIVTVGTPIVNSKINLESLKEAIQQIVPALKDDDLVIIRSTTAVGTCREVVLPILLGTQKRIHLAMCPERTVEGKALEEMSSLPQIVGALDDISFNHAQNLFEKIGPEIVRVSSLEAAELSKLVNNTYRDLMFGFANEIANFANAMNLSAREVITAANHNYARSNISQPGISGGPCLEKDPWILVESGEIRGRQMPISRASRVMNESIIDSFLDARFPSILNVTKIAILGLAFKGNPETKDLRGSAVFPVYDKIRNYFPNSNVMGFEPAGLDKINLPNFVLANTLVDAVKDAQVIILLTNSLTFSKASESINKHAAQDCVILDFWGRDFESNFSPTQKYFTWAGAI